MKTLLITLLGFFLMVSSFAQSPTQVTIRAKAKDAKFVGSSIGGAHVVVREKTTGKLLAEGLTKGSTGSTKLIMETPKTRSLQIAEETTAAFVAELAIAEPTFISVEVTAPINQKQAAVTVSTELWVIPGKDILGDGLVLEVPGFVIDVLAPRTYQRLSLKEIEEEGITFRANIVMMCGCPISDGGMWDANDMEVKGIIKRNGTLLTEIEAKVTTPNVFEGTFMPKETGNYELILYAFNASTGNTGVDKVNFIVND